MTICFKVTQNAAAELKRLSSQLEQVLTHLDGDWCIGVVIYLKNVEIQTLEYVETTLIMFKAVFNRGPT